jgi:hypothetical protein
MWLALREWNMAPWCGYGGVGERCISPDAYDAAIDCRLCKLAATQPLFLIE